MKWLRRKKDDVARSTRDDYETYEDKLASRMRALPSVEFDDPEAVEARIRRMNYGAKVEHRPAWMAVDDWEEQADTA